MTISKCTACHHEWQGPARPCDWCGKPGEVIGEAYPEPARVESTTVTEDGTVVTVTPLGDGASLCEPQTILVGSGYRFSRVLEAMRSIHLRGPDIDVVAHRPPDPDIIDQMAPIIRRKKNHHGINQAPRGPRRGQ